MKKVILFFTGLVAMTLQNQAQKLTDYDGNVYETITIGNQVWMKENFKATHYRNGDKIVNITDDKQWTTLTNGAWCYYENKEGNGTVYAKLYNWYAVHDPRGLCPTGWHVPGDAEWQTLFNYLGGDSIAGDKMKETGTTHWNSPNAGANNNSGFSALPGGYRDFSDGSFFFLGNYGIWWSITENNTSGVGSRTLYYNNSKVGRSDVNKAYGFSVRCLRD